MYEAESALNEVPLMPDVEDGSKQVVFLEKQIYRYKTKIVE